VQDGRPSPLYVLIRDVKPQLPGAYFTIEVDGRPTIVFHAERLAHARELAREKWLRDDLNELRSNGEPLCTPTSKMTARVATAEEIVAVRDVAHAKSNGDEIVITYLVELDCVRKSWTN
jgi:hypothetical protein